MTLLPLDENTFQIYQAEIREIEANTYYPLGDDSFYIDHGRNYFDFFNRMGKIHYYLWKEGEEVAAVVCFVLREIPERRSNQVLTVWYICDLKVHPKFRGKRVVFSMLKSVLKDDFFKKGYAISMNPVGLDDNRMVKLWHHLGLVPIQKIPLKLWSLDMKEMLEVQPILEKYRGPVHYASLSGVKDLVLLSTHQPIPILHAQFGPMAYSEKHIMNKNAKYMFCSPAADLMVRELEEVGCASFASAGIISHGMPIIKWDWVLTSEI